jgi:predicted aspartyl protease
MAPTVMATLLVCLSNLQVQSDRAPVRSSSSVNFTMAPNGAPIVEILIDNHVKARMAVDTGTNISFVSTKLASRANLKRSTVKDSDGKPFELVTIQVWTVGSMPFSNSEFLTVDATKVEMEIGRDIDGILGANAFASNALQIDYIQKKLTLWTEGAMTQSDIQAAGFAAVKALDLTLDSSEGGIRPFVSAQLDGRLGLNMLIDTGSARTFITSRAASTLALTPIRRDRSFKTPSHASAVSVGVVRSFQLGSLSADNVEVTFPGDRAEAGEALLGNNLLHRCEVLLDLPSKHLYLKPVPGAILRALPGLLPEPVRGDSG